MTIKIETTELASAIKEEDAQKKKDNADKRRWRMYIALLLIIFFVCISGFLLIPRPMSVEATGTLEPLHQQPVTSFYRGIAKVTSVHVKTGDFVEKGTVLAILEPDGNLYEKIGAIETEIAEEKQKQIANTRLVSRNAGTLNEAQLNEKIEANKVSSTSIAEKKLELQQLMNEKENLVLKALISGYVTDPKTTEGLVNQTYQGGDTVFKMTDPAEEWGALLMVPEEQIPYVRSYNATKVRKGSDGKEISEHGAVFYLGYDSLNPVQGTVTRIGLGPEKFHENAVTKEFEAVVAFPRDAFGLEDRRSMNSLQSVTITGHIDIGYHVPIVYYTRGIRQFLARQWYIW